MRTPGFEFAILKNLFLSVVCAVPPAAAPIARADAPFKLAVKKTEPPKPIADPIRTVLRHEVLELTEDGKPFFAFWLRKQVPLPTKPDREAFGIASLKPGTLLGVLQVHEKRYDFRDEEIPPGLYTLRFALQPQDGDHLGTAPTRTFALLVPAKDDKTLDGFADQEKLNEAAATVNPAEHPANLNIQRVEKTDGAFPRLASHHDDEHKVIYLQIPAGFPGEPKTTLLTFALVYDGIGEL